MCLLVNEKRGGGKMSESPILSVKNLKTYFDVLKEDGAIEFKTDNDSLFEFSMEEIRESGYEILEYTEDLHSSDYESKHMTTEYEDRFSAAGKNINYVKFKRKTASK